MNEKIKQATTELFESYSDTSLKIHHLDRQPLPSP